MKNSDLTDLQCITKHTRANSGGLTLTQIQEILNPLTVADNTYAVEQLL